MISEIGKLLIALGLGIAAIGAVLVWFPGLRLGRLPGDVSIDFRNGRFYFPVATSILISVLLSLVLMLANWITRK